MNIIETKLKDCIIIEPKVFGDERGFFLETFQLKRYADLAGISLTFVQDNHSRSSKNVLRGLHFQKTPYAQGKLVRVSRGAIYDVAVDIRPGSTTYKQWVARELTADNKVMLWIPPGFAHGFLALTDQTIVHYKVSSAEYNPSSEASIMWNDEDLNIDWPIETEAKLAAKDLNAMTLIEYEKTFL